MSDNRRDNDHRDLTPGIDHTHQVLIAEKNLAVIREHRTGERLIKGEGQEKEKDYYKVFIVKDCGQ